MSFSILQHCSVRSLPSGFRHFQPESAEDSCPPARKIRGRPAEGPRRSAQLSAGVRAEQPRIPRKRLSFRRIRFSLLRSAITAIRGSRSSNHATLSIVDLDCCVPMVIAEGHVPSAAD